MTKGSGAGRLSMPSRTASGFTSTCFRRFPTLNTHSTRLPRVLIAITNRQGTFYDWSASNPKGYGDWFDGKNREAFIRVLAERRQKDVEARWTKKHGKSHYGYKNHVNVDRRHKLVRRYHVSEHDSQVLDDILDGDNTALGVWADSAYRSAEIEAALKEKGLRSRIHRKGRRNKPLSEREKQGNKTRSSVRVRVEHVFGAQSNDMGGTLVRSVGLVRAKARIGLKNLAYNMRRLVQLERLAAAV